MVKYSLKHTYIINSKEFQTSYETYPSQGRASQQYRIKAIFSLLESKEIQKQEVKQLHQAVNNIVLSKHSDIQYEHLSSNETSSNTFQHLLIHTCIITQMKIAGTQSLSSNN